MKLETQAIHTGYEGLGIHGKGFCISPRRQM